MTVGETHIEFKYNIDTMGESLAKDLKKWPDMLEMWKGVQQGEASKTWSTMAKVYQDVCGNEKKHRPDLFLWIICSRDLKHVALAELVARRVCWWKQQLKYNRTTQHSRSGPRLEVVSEFLDRLSKRRRFTRKTEAIVTKGDLFESTSHFVLCDFTDKQS